MNEYGKQVKKTMDTYIDNPDSIDKEISDIQNATHGVEVRGALAAGVKKSFDKSVEARDITENLLDGSYDQGLLNTEIENRMDNLYNTKGQAMDELHDAKETELDNLKQEYADKATTLETTYAPRLTSIETEIEDARGGETNLGDRLNEFSSQLAQIAINLLDYGAVAGGSVDCTPAITQALNQINAVGGGRIYAPFSAIGYKFSEQIILEDNTILDLNGSTLVRSGELSTSTKSVIKVNGSGNKIQNIICQVQSNQYLIEYSETSRNNEEFNCREITSGRNRQIIKNEKVNNNAKTNSSKTLESISLAKQPLKKIRKYKMQNVSLNANQMIIFRFRDFPSICKIKRLIVKDENGSPDFLVTIYNQGTSSKLYERPRASNDLDEDLYLEYFREEIDDIMRFRIYNYKATSTTFRIEIWFDEEEYLNPKKVWQYVSEDDFKRPHADSVGSFTTVSQTTIKAIEYRYRTSEGGSTVYRKSITPTRKTDEYYNYPLAKIPNQQGTQNSTYSQLKFYFDFSAKNAVLEKPSNFVFILKSPPKSINCDVVMGWISQNRDNDTGFLQTSMIYPNEEPFKLTTGAEDVEYKFTFPIDPKSYQLGSSLGSPTSFDFFYFILITGDEQPAFLFGEEYQFNAYFE